MITFDLFSPYQLFNSEAGCGPEGSSNLKLDPRLMGHNYPHEPGFEPRTWAYECLNHLATRIPHLTEYEIIIIIQYN